VKTSLGMLLLAGFLAGCFHPSDKPASSHYDVVTGRRTDVMEDNMLTPPAGTPPREVVWLNATRDMKRRGDSDFYLEVVYMAREDAGYLNIGAGESLVVVADGRELKFKGSGSGSMRSTENGFVHEHALYGATQVQIQIIAVAREVKVVIRGDNGLVEREFKKENFDRFRTFVTMYAL